ncbi:MAG: HEAT repeat domain-containing protein [Bellilinea sp.]|jgi:hypothetical protein
MHDPRSTNQTGFEADENPPSAEARRTLEGLLFVLDYEPDLNLRLKAVRALGQFREMNALRALAETALYDEDEPIRIAARQQVESLFGAEAETFLEVIRIEIEGEDDEDEDEDEFWSDFKPQQTASRAPSVYNESPSVMQEERPPIWLWALLGAAALGGIWFFFIR